MARHRRKSIIGIIFSKVIGFVIFLAVLYLMNMLVPFIHNEFFSDMVGFLDRNFIYLLIMSIVFLAAGIIDALPFPVNLPAPLISAAGAILVMIFIGRIILFVGGNSDSDIPAVLKVLSYVAYPVVFLIVLIGGYISILIRLVAQQKEDAHHPVPEENDNVINVNRVKTWKEVGDGFRQAFSDFFYMLSRSIRK